MALLLQEKLNEKASWALWHILESEEELLDRLQAGARELEELSIIRNETRRLEWLACRILLKQLAYSQQVNYTELKKDSFGKPYLAGSPAFISLSHSFPFAAAILNTEKEVGIDIEKSRSQLLRIRHKFLNQKELSCAGDNLEKLCVFWTAKEALYKLYGKRGLHLQEDIQIDPFELEEEGEIIGRLVTKQIKESFTLHYHRYQDLHVCFSL